MRYKGYIARIEYSEEDNCLVGHISGIRDIVGFHGDSLKQIRKAFEEAVDDYLATCSKIGRDPQKPYSGKFMLRVSPDIHAKIVAQAQVAGKSLNQWVGEMLSEAVKR